MVVVSSARYHWPAEWAPHQGTVIAWPEREDLWSGRVTQVRELFGRIAGEILAGAELHLAGSSQSSADGALDIIAAPDDFAGRLHLHRLPFNDVWVRDSAALRLLSDDGRQLALDFRFNGWGAKFQPHDDDDRLGALLAAQLGDAVRRRQEFVEGGAIETDGSGLLDHGGGAAESESTPGPGSPLFRVDLRRRVRSTNHLVG